MGCGNSNSTDVKEDKNFNQNDSNINQQNQINENNNIQDNNENEVKELIFEQKNATTLHKKYNYAERYNYNYNYNNYNNDGHQQNNNNENNNNYNYSNQANIVCI